ncbi:MAG: hypothetical protein LBQ15_03760 [Clostridium sp.]|jgi:hypothetical protein|nr:hypothetical protein [Clostridium sp.]
MKKKFRFMPVVEKNPVVTAAAGFLYVAGIFGIAFGTVVLCAANQIMGIWSMFLFFGLFFGGNVLWRIAWIYLLKPFQKPDPAKG